MRAKTSAKRTRRDAGSAIFGAGNAIFAGTTVTGLPQLVSRENALGEKRAFLGRSRESA
jgi:hypothetical protein